MTLYDGYTNWNAGEYPAVLAIGDSWFWYPKNNLLEALCRHPIQFAFPPGVKIE